MEAKCQRTAVMMMVAGIPTSTAGPCHEGQVWLQTILNLNLKYTDWLSKNEFYQPTMLNDIRWSL